MSEDNQEVIEDTVEVAEVIELAEEDFKMASKEDVNAVLDAVKELTTIVGDLHKENVKWFRAGKMGGA